MSVLYQTLLVASVYNLEVKCRKSIYVHSPWNEGLELLMSEQSLERGEVLTTCNQCN